MILAPNEHTLAQALQTLQQGQLLGLPTETVYGLAADAGQDAAIARIYARKGRPRNHPLIVHVHDARAAEHFAAEIPAFARALMDAFWPGPLTLILPRRAGVAEAAAAGLPSIGLRCPEHPVARQLLALCMDAQPPIHGLAAPSANRFGRISPTRARHVEEEFNTADDAEAAQELPILDGGECSVGIESTIVDCTRGQPIILRPGHIGAAQIAQASGMPALSEEEAEALGRIPPAPQAPGTLLAHYAPNAKVRLMDAASIQTALHVLGAQGKNLAVYARTALQSPSRQIPIAHMPADAQAAARELFHTLRQLDGQGVKLIWVETPPDDPEWDGVRDRLERAAAA